MASYYTQKRSPYYWLRIKKPDGTWGAVNSGVRLDDPDAKRKLKGRIAREQVKEVDYRDVPRLETWVPGFLHVHYSNALSLQRAQNAWAALAVFLEERDVTVPSQITRTLAHDYLAWRQSGESVKKRSRNTAILEVKILSVIAQEAVRRDWLMANPLLKLGIKRGPTKVKAEVTLDEQAIIERELANEPQWMRDAWLVAMRQGFRLRETAVPMGDIDVVNRTVFLVSKGGKRGVYPLHPDLLPLIERRRGERLLVDLPPMPSKAWFLFFQRIGMGHLSFHSTRVTVVTRFARAGVPVSQAMAYVGHASETVHRIYQRLSPADVGHLGDLLK